MASPTVVFFDGVCNLCNGFVDYLVRLDRKGALRFASLQGKAAHELLGWAPRFSPEEAIDAAFDKTGGKSQ